MIARVAKAMNEKEKGFTLIELLVVIIIIGILAAIAIPVFMNQRQRAVDTGIKSDIRSIANEVESYYADNQEYPADATNTDDKIEIGDTEVTLSDATSTYEYTSSGQAYTITGVNSDKGTGKDYVYKSDEGGLQD